MSILTGNFLRFCLLLRIRGRTFLAMGTTLETTFLKSIFWRLALGLMWMLTSVLLMMSLILSVNLFFSRWGRTLMATGATFLAASLTLEMMDLARMRGRTFLAMGRAFLATLTTLLKENSGGWPWG